MESSASAHRASRSDSTVKLVNSFNDLVTGVLGVMSTPLTIGVIVVVSLVAFNDYERWNHRDLGPASAHELDLAIVQACRSQSAALWTCVGQTKRQLNK